MISASIVLFNTQKEELLKVIKSYSPSKERILFIIDNSKNKLVTENIIKNEYIYYIFNNKNIGFGKAHNIGLKYSIQKGCRYHIILNTDLEFKKNIIDEITTYMEKNSDIIYLLPKVYYPNGEIQYLCKLLPNPFNMIIRGNLLKFKIFKNINDKFILLKFGYDKIINPPCLSGCFMFLNMTKIKEFQIFFDKRFFLYYEDFDFIRRCHRIGKTVFYPNVQIIHHHKKMAHKDIKLFIIFLKSTLKYFNKYGWFFDKERKEMNIRILNEIKYNKYNNKICIKELK